VPEESSQQKEKWSFNATRVLPQHRKKTAKLKAKYTPGFNLAENSIFQQDNR